METANTLDEIKTRADALIADIATLPEEERRAVSLSVRARLSGAATSDTKAVTSAANGRKGGRPKGTPQSQATRDKISAAKSRAATSAPPAEKT